jgi:hypothetical protein
MSAFELNEQNNLDIRIVGNEQTPVIVIDRPVIATEKLIRCASQHQGFHVDRRFAYPGVRAELPDYYVNTLLPVLLTLLHDVYEIPAGLQHQLFHRLFSLITTPPDDLAVLQRVPHFDTVRPYYFATVHYLNPGSYGGTGLFRHRPTGFERVSEDRYPSYVQAVESHMKSSGLPAAEYIKASNDQYELIAEVNYKPNRLIMYPGNLLHSGLIRPDRDISVDPVNGRLTANLFLDFVDS